jgi:LPS-assembly lipoprotein
MPTRRDGLHAFAAMAASAALAGCGFELRRAPALPFRRMALVGFSDKTSTADELRRALPDDVTVVDDPRDADVVLEALTDLRRRSVAASTAAGQVREVTLVSTLTYRLSTRGGKPLLPPATIELRRDMSYSETLALGKADEEQTLWRAMEADIAMQVLRRLAATPPL